MRNVLLAEPALIPFVGLGLLLVLLLAILLTVVVAVVALLIRNSGKKPTPPSASPPIHPLTEVIRRCPKCRAELKSDLPEGLCPSCLLQHGLATEGGAPPGSQAFTPPPLAELAKMFPQLELLEIIGQGGMGAVYKARQPALDRFVALKILAPRGGGDLDFSGRFSREARALAKLSHPNIVGVHDFGTVGQASSLSPSEKSGEKSETGKMPVLHYFIMEYVDGPNLRQLEQGKKLSPREALQIIPQICAALQFAHDEGIVHRDIKPENVLLDKKGRVKIADFGLAKILGQEADFRLTGARDVMGTPHYMAPEQVEKPQEVDHRADIYSLGVVFYEMLTGDLPIGKFDPPSHKVQIDVRLDDVVLRSLANNPDRRYQQVGQIKTEVENITSTQARTNPGFAAGFAPGWEYKSARTLFGLPLLHVSGGINPATGKANVSRGIFAFGQVAKGLYASGGRAYGLVAFGGIAGGFLSIGGIALGGVALGALALGILALGSLSGGAAGIGAVPFSMHHISNIKALFLMAFIAILLVIGLALIHFVIYFWARPRANTSPSVFSASTGPSEWKLLGLAATPVLLASLLFAAFSVHSRYATGFKTGSLVSAGVELDPTNSETTTLEASLKKPALEIFTDADLKAPKTIVLTRATNQLLNASNDLRTISIWSDTYLQPGETISTLAQRGPNKLQKYPSTLFTRTQPDGVKISSSFNWTFGPQLGQGFGDAAAEAADAQLRENFNNHPIKLFPGQSQQLFSITNNAGEVMTGSIEFARSLPQPIPSGEPAKATIHLRHFAAYSTTSFAIDYVAEVPEGYALWSTAKNGGEGYSFTPSGPYQYHSEWNLPPRFHSPRIESPDRYLARQKSLELQLQDLQDHGPITVIFGQPKLLVTITNADGESFPGFLELVAPKKSSATNESAKSASDYKTNRVSASTEQRRLIEKQKARYQESLPRTMPAPAPLLPLLPPVIRPLRSLRDSTSTLPIPSRLTTDTSALAPEEQLRLIDIQRKKFVEAGHPEYAQLLPPVPPLATVNPLTGVPPPAQTISQKSDPNLLLKSQPAVIVETFPVSGVNDVAPGETEIRVRFSKDMEAGSWSWVNAGENSTTEAIGTPRFLDDGRTCMIKVHLNPGRTYAWWLNSDDSHNFKDKAGVPSVPYLLIFQTKSN